MEGFAPFADKFTDSKQNCQRNGRVSTLVVYLLNTGCELQTKPLFTYMASYFTIEKIGTNLKDKYQYP